MTPVEIEQKYFPYQDNYRLLDTINPNDIADLIMNNEEIITLGDTDEIFSYNENTGLYEPFEQELEAIIQVVCAQKTKVHLVKEIIESVRRRTRKDRSIIGKNPNHIPMDNGIYDFEKGELLEYSPELVFMTKHPITYRKPKENEIVPDPISEFIVEVTGSQEDEVLLKEIVGYCFYRSYPFQNFFILTGSGANGKSTFINIMRKMLGVETLSNRSLQDLSENRFAVSDLYGKNANIVGDLPAKGFKDVGMIKQATGGDHLTAEQKYKNSFQFVNYAKIIAACNEVPETPDASDGFFRRAVIITFPNCFDGKENRNLAEELGTKENLSTFFNTSIEAFKDALRDNYLIGNESTVEKKKKYLRLSNSAQAFCESYLEYEPEEEIAIEDIYKKYKDYCKEKKLVARDERSFFMKLYKIFNHKVYKMRKNVAGVRYHVIVGLNWL